MSTVDILDGSKPRPQRPPTKGIKLMKYNNLLLTLALAITTTGVAFADTLPATAGNAATASGPATAPAGSTAQAGEVVSSTTSELVILTSAGQRQVYVVDAMTVPPVPFNVGDQVLVTYHSLAGGGYHAASIDLQPIADADLAADPNGELAATTNEDLAGVVPPTHAEIAMASDVDEPVAVADEPMIDEPVAASVVADANVADEPVMAAEPVAPVTAPATTYDANEASTLDADEQSSDLDARLPDTASNLPLIGLLGLLALGGAFFLRARS
jgi:hypothetical protein